MKKTRKATEKTTPRGQQGGINVSDLLEVVRILDVSGRFGMVMLIIKRGIVDDPSRTGLPYMRLDEMMELYNKRHPSPSISDAFLAGLKHFQQRIDKKRVAETYERIDNLLKVV